MPEREPFLVFAASLRLLRIRQGVSRAELARRLACNETLVRRWEAGNSLPPSWWWPRLVAALGLRPADLVLLLASAFEPATARWDPDGWQEVAATLTQQWRRGQDAPAGVASLLRAVRQRHGLTQARMAGELGVSWHRYRDWETGRRRPSLGTLALVFRGRLAPQEWGQVMLALSAEGRP